MSTFEDYKREVNGIVSDIKAELKSTVVTNQEFKDYFEEQIIKNLNDIKETAKNKWNAAKRNGAQAQSRRI